MERPKELSMDQTFLQSLKEIVLSNLENDQFGAEDISKEIGLSRSQVHRKLQKINGKSITQFIRETRLDVALDLLKKEVGTASEISYQVGFSSPAYFTKCFHEYFGYPPSEAIYRSKVSESISIGGTPSDSSNIIPIHGRKMHGSDSDYRKLTTIMFSDICGYTAIMEESEKEAISLLKRNRKLHQSIIELYNGQLVKEIGDAIMASFDSPSDAVHCARQIISASKDEDNLKLHIGIHLGEIHFIDGDIYGDGVNIASRINSIAKEGEVLISEEVYKNVKNKENIFLEEVGEKKFKNVKDPIDIFKVIDQGTKGYKKISNTSLVKEKFGPPWRWIALLLIAIIMVSVWLNVDFNLSDTSNNEDLPTEKVTIAVLPFENQSSDPNQEFFNEGIAENIRNKLSRLSNLRVIAWTSTKIYKTKIANAKKIGEDLDTDYLLEGLVFKVDNRIRINVSLIECKSGLSMWSESYEREFSNILNLQNEIAVNITRKLQINLTEKEYFTLQEIKDINPDIYTEFLYAGSLKEAFEEKNDSSYNKSAIELLNQIIKTEPLFAEAYVELAWNLWNTKFYNMQLFESIGTDSIMKVIDKAINLNPDYPESYYFLANFYYWKNDLENRKLNLEKVIELDPNNYEAMFGMYGVLLNQRDFENAIKYLLTAIRIKPINIHSDHVDLQRMHSISSALSNIFLIEESELILKKMIEMDSMGACNRNALYFTLAQLCRKQGKMEEYLHWSKTDYHCDSTDFYAINKLGLAHVRIGDYEKGIFYYNLSFSQARLKPADDTTWWMPHKAYAYQQLGKNDEANRLLESFLVSNKNPKLENWSWKTSNMAEAYALIGDKKRALELLKSMPFDTYQFIPENELLYKLNDKQEFQEILQSVKAEEERIRKIAMSPEIQREVRRLMKKLDIH